MKARRVTNCFWSMVWRETGAVRKAVRAPAEGRPPGGGAEYFKGGTCLKKCYFETYRFSEDLDFTLRDGSHLDEELLKKVFVEIVFRKKPKRYGQLCQHYMENGLQQGAGEVEV